MLSNQEPASGALGSAQDRPQQANMFFFVLLNSLPFALSMALLRNRVFPRLLFLKAKAYLIREKSEAVFRFLDKVKPQDAFDVTCLS
jgi:hypothetical protein